MRRPRLALLAVPVRPAAMEPAVFSGASPREPLGPLPRLPWDHGLGTWARALARLRRGQEGEAWLVVIATFVTLGLTYGFWYAYSVFLVAFIKEFGWSRSVVAGAFSLLVLVIRAACSRTVTPCSSASAMR